MARALPARLPGPTVPATMAAAFSSRTLARLTGAASSRSIVRRSSSPATDREPCTTAYRITSIGPMNDISSIWM